MKNQLDHNKNYSLLKVVPGNCNCDNCNRPLKKVALLESDNLELYAVGVVCADNLTELKNESVKSADKIASKVLKKINQVKADQYGAFHFKGTEADKTVHLTFRETAKKGRMKTTRFSTSIDSEIFYKFVLIQAGLKADQEGKTIFYNK